MSTRFQPPNRPPSSSPFSSSPRPNSNLPQSPNSLLQRMGSKVNWTLLPTADEIACFNLSTPSSEALRALGIRMESNSLADLLRMVKEDRSEVQTLREALDTSWRAYGLRGAVLVYNWRDDLREGVAARLNAIKQPPIYLQVTEPLLVLNVLARARTSLLLAHAPLALEHPYLSRALASDDPRLLALARNMGCTRELLVGAETKPSEADE